MEPLPMYVAVKALIFQGNKILLLFKSKGKFWDFPGGRINPSEDVIPALKRELAEELPDFKKYSIGKLVGVRKKEQPLADGYELFLSYFLVTNDSDQNTLTLSSEHTEAKYFSYEEVAELNLPLNRVYSELMKKVLEEKQSGAV